MSSDESLKRKQAEEEEVDALHVIFREEREKAKRRLAEIDKSEKLLKHATQDIRLTFTAFNVLLDQLSDIYADTPRELMESATAKVSQLKAEGLRLVRQLGARCPGIDESILEDWSGSLFKEVLAKNNISPDKQPNDYIMRNRELWQEYRNVLVKIEDVIIYSEGGKSETMDIGHMSPECAELVARVINIEQHVRYTEGDCLYCKSRNELFCGSEFLEKEKIKHVTYSWTFYKAATPKE